MTAETNGESTDDELSGDSLTSKHGHIGDSVFKAVSASAGGLILIILAATALFLIIQAIPAFLGGPQYQPQGDTWQYVAPYLFGTIWASFLALLIAIPVAVGIALYITHYAPAKLSTPVAFVIDLLAAVPSVIFGLWGINTLAPALVPIYEWLNAHASWIPLFRGPVVSGTGRTMLTVALVLAIMVLPIITSLSREVFLRTPKLQEEASLALGATRWEMIKQVVFPFGRSGVISASMLGLGRALGETMAVAMVLSGGRTISFGLLSSKNPNTIAANIALSFPEADTFNVPQLIATGLVLFVITFIVNFLGRMISGRKGILINRPKNAPRKGTK